MATPKQIEYIQFACGRLGRRVLSSEDIQALSREKIDNLIKELNVADTKKNGNNSASSYNGNNMRRNAADAFLGMCFKLYVNNAGVSTAVVNESETHRVVEPFTTYTRESAPK